MVKDIKPSRIAIWCLVLGGAAGIFTLGTCAISAFRPRPMVEPLICQPLPPQISWLGPSLTLRQLSGKSPVHSTDSDFPMYFPSNRHDADWRFFLQGFQTGDSVHEFRTTYSNGYVLLRKQCLVARIILNTYFVA